MKPEARRRRGKGTGFAPPSPPERSIRRTVVHFTDATAFGGAERILLILLAGLDRQRWTPVLLHRGHTGIMPLVHEAQALDIRTREVPPVSGWWDLMGLVRFIRRLRAERPTVFHAHMAWTLRCRYELAAALLARTPAVIATQQLYMLYDEFLLEPAMRWQRFLCQRLGRYIVVSHAIARDLPPTCRTVPPRVAVIHNAVPLERYVRCPDPALRLALLRGAERSLVLTIARLDQQKGLDDLLNAAALVPQATFVIAGAGPEREALEAQRDALGLREQVVFLGHREDVPELLAACDLFVLPSHFEGLPVSVVEAMAAAKPVVATDVGGTSEAVVHGETGLLVPARHPEGLAHAINSMLADQGLAQRFGVAGRARAQREFSAEVMVQRVARVYEEVLEERGVAHACS